MSFFTIFVILAINMLMAFVLLLDSVKINYMNIHNAAKIELNNVSAHIYADTFHKCSFPPCAVPRRKSSHGQGCS